MVGEHNDRMISSTDARALKDIGLRWEPASGDRFCIDTAELEHDVFTVSEMTVEPHQFDTGTILGFNGTTEWALDSVAIENALWLPREDQLRDLLGGAFRSLTKTDVAFDVEIILGGAPAHFCGDDPPTAYGDAVFALISSAITPVSW